MSNSYLRSKATKTPLKYAVEIIQDRLYFVSLKTRPTDGHVLARDGKKRPIHYFCVDSELVYWNFFLDFGPLNLGQLYRFCHALNNKLSMLRDHVICFYSSTMPAKRANAVCLICCWQLLYLNRTPEQSFHGFDPTLSSMDRLSNASNPPRITEKNVTTSPLPPFHDASPCACTYELTVMDCLRGLAKARAHQFFDFSTFNANEYEFFEQVENGDLNWIIKGKIIAFAGPSYDRYVSPEGYCTLSPADYIPYFKENKVSLVVRLNKKNYNEEDFLNAGIGHFEQFYPDGSCPKLRFLYSILDAFESVPKGEAFAVHCKAGLGRTGTCIGAYIMKHYRFTAAEAIAWMRICRPGMVIGPQQQFLQQIEKSMWQLGKQQYYPYGGNQLGNVSVMEERQVSAQMSSVEHYRDSTDEAVVGRAGQAEGLLAARRHREANSSSSTSSKSTPPSTPESKRVQSKVVTPDPPGRSICDGGFWYI